MKPVIPAFLGIGLMIAKALENNGAIVYIVGRREEILRKAASDNNVRYRSLSFHTSL